MLKRILFVWSIILLFAGCTHDPLPLPVLSDKFSDIQKQTLDKSCAYGGCHDSSDMPKALLWLAADSSYNQLRFIHVIQSDVAAARFKALVVPYQPDSSYLVYKLTLNASSTDYGDRMPSRLKGLPQNEIDAIIRWIRRGAPND